MNDRPAFRFAGASADAGTPIEVARAVRPAVGLPAGEPVRNISRLLEDNGVKLLLLETTRDSFFGLSVGERDGGPAVVVNTWDRISVERWIFTAAHELGHLLLHPADCRRDATEMRGEAEREADVFASEFLMPEAAFATEWNATSGHPLLVRVLKVKRIFRVSYMTVLHRIARQVPVDEAVAPGMEVEPLLPDRRAGEHEGSKRAVERGADGVLADVLAVVRANVAEAQGEHGANPQLLAYDGSAGHPSLGPKELSVDTSTGRVHQLDELAGALRGDLVGGASMSLRARLRRRSVGATASRRRSAPNSASTRGRLY